MAAFSAAAGISEQRTGASASVAGRLPRNEDDARALAAVINKNSNSRWLLTMQCRSHC
jgi:hypothetical protein